MLIGAIFVKEFHIRAENTSQHTCERREIGLFELRLEFS